MGWADTIYATFQGGPLDGRRQQVPASEGGAPESLGIYHLEAHLGGLDYRYVWTHRPPPTIREGVRRRSKGMPRRK